MTLFKTAQQSALASGDARESSRWTFEARVAALIVALAAVRLVVAALMPLASDELLYWRYSRHLAAGFLDHPALNPLLIRLGTMLFGDGPLGVRFFAVALSLPASWAVWQAGASLLQNKRAGALAALFFNLTLVMGVGSLLATSDSAVVITSAFVLLALAKLNETQRGVWWLVVGAAFGAGMFAKYTTFFFAFGVAAWLLLVPENRKWFRSPWPYLGGLVAAVIFSPVLLWNAEHQWASAAYQSSRMVIREWSLRYAFELIGSQIGLATPPIFIMACVGLIWGGGEKGAPRGVHVLLTSLTLPTLAYFLWHSLHERVQGNWPECIFPAVCCLAALAANLQSPGRALGGWIVWSRRLAAPVGLGLAALVYAQAIFSIIPWGHGDPTARLLTKGWAETAAQIDALRARAGAPVVLASDYTSASALTYYLPSHPEVVQINDRVRWINEPPVDPALFAGQMIYVCKDNCKFLPQFPQRFREIEYLGTVPRMHEGVVMERYSVYRLAGVTHGPLDDPYPVRLKGVNDDTL